MLRRPSSTIMSLTCNSSIRLQSTINFTMNHIIYIYIYIYVYIYIYIRRDITEASKIFDFTPFKSALKINKQQIWTRKERERNNSSSKMITWNKTSEF